LCLFFPTREGERKLFQTFGRRVKRRRTWQRNGTCRLRRREKKRGGDHLWDVYARAFKRRGKRYGTTWERILCIRWSQRKEENPGHYKLRNSPCRAKPSITGAKCTRSTMCSKKKGGEFKFDPPSLLGRRKKKGGEFLSAYRKKEQTGPTPSYKEK